MIAVQSRGLVAAEVDKLRTLPAVGLSMLGTVLAGAVLAGIQVAAASATVPAERAPVTAAYVVLASVPYLQAGLVLVGAWPVAHEHAGRQLGTSLRAVPRRTTFVMAKTIAALVPIVLTAALATGAALLAAAVVRTGTGAAPAPAPPGAAWLLAGAVAHLTLVGLLSHAVALLVRHLVPTLVGVLGLVLIASPVLSGITAHARWLPDRAAAQLYDRTDEVLTWATGALVALAWIALIGGMGVARLVRRDA